MKTLANSMRSDKGRSTEYQNLVKAINAAAALDEKTANMSDEDKQEGFAANQAVAKVCIHSNIILDESNG